MATERTVRLFRNGRNQALRIPRELEFDCEEATLRKEGDRLIVEPIYRRGLLKVLASLEPIDDEFPDMDSSLLPLDDVALRG